MVAVAVMPDGARLTLRAVPALALQRGDCLPDVAGDQTVCDVRPLGASIVCVMGDGAEIPFPPRQTVRVARSRKHRADCTHCARIRDLAMQYRLAREAAELQREYVTGSYSSELKEYKPIITFKQWLQNTAA